MKNAILALGFSLTASLATPGYAVTLGQPLIIAEANGSGFILDFFDGTSPTGLKEVSASADVTQQFGVSGYLGQTIDYTMDLDGNGTLSIGTYELNIFTWAAGYAGAQGDSFGPDTPFVDNGLISTTFEVQFPILSSMFDPITGIEMFTFDPFETGTPITSADGPFAQIGVNIFYEGTLPTKFFDDPDFPAIYIEGAFTPSRIEVGLIGGPPVQVSPVPLPASLPLAFAALGALGWLRRKKTC